MKPQRLFWIIRPKPITSRRLLSIDGATSAFFFAPGTRFRILSTLIPSRHHGREGHSLQGKTGKTHAVRPLTSLVHISFNENPPFSSGLLVGCGQFVVYQCCLVGNLVCTRYPVEISSCVLSPYLARTGSSETGRQPCHMSSITIKLWCQW